MEPIHFNVLAKETRKVFSDLSKLSFIKQFYLAGGTAAALYLAHRLSEDLDFFSTEQFDESLLLQKLSEDGKFALEQKAEQTVTGIFNDTKVTFLGYNYPLLEPLKNADGIFAADLLDIACMKLDAISSRGARRDFIDVYFIAKEFALLSEILKKFEEKYASVKYNMMHVRKSLLYFDDADRDPMPKMLKPVSWDAVKKFFQSEIAKLS